MIIKLMYCPYCKDNTTSGTPILCTACNKDKVITIKVLK